MFPTLLVALAFIFSACNQAHPPEPVQNDVRQVTYAEVRKDVKAGGKTLEKDVAQRLDVLEVFIEDMMERYRTTGEERREELKPEVQKLQNLVTEVRGQVDAYSPGEEQQSKKQVKKIIDTMQKLRSTYQGLVTKLGITWH